MKKIYLAFVTCMVAIFCCTVNTEAFYVSGGGIRPDLSNEDKSENKYTSGQYKVGTDIPAGEYVLFASGSMGYFCVSSDGNQDDIITNENFEYNTIITVSDGQYFELERCYALPFNEVKAEDLDLSGDGMFKVGTHIPAGEYKLNADSSSMGYYCIYNSSDQLNIISNNNFDGSQYVTVQNGQYLKLNRCSFDSIPEMVYEDAETIKQVQEKLNEKGYNCGTADGISGPNTQAAIIQFKKDNGLGEDARITQGFLDRLMEEPQTTEEGQNITLNPDADKAAQDAQSAYLEAINMSPEDLVYDEIGSASYNGIHIISEETTWCEAGAIYRSIAEKIEGFYVLGDVIYGAYDADVFPLVFNIEKPSTYEEAKPYFDKVQNLIKNDGNVGIWTAFQNASSITGQFDYENKIAEFTIESIQETANELGISGRMLGYIIAEFQEYGSEITFDGNSCSVSCKPFGM